MEPSLQVTTNEANQPKTSSRSQRNCCAWMGRIVSRESTTRVLAIGLVVMVCFAALFKIANNSTERTAFSHRNSRENHTPKRNPVKMLTRLLPTADSTNKLCASTLRSLRRHYAGDFLHSPSGAELFLKQATNLFQDLSAKTHQVFAELEGHSHSTIQGRSDSVHQSEYWEDLQLVSNTTDSTDEWGAVIGPTSFVVSPRQSILPSLIDDALKIKDTASVILFSSPFSHEVLPHLVLVKPDLLGGETLRKIADTVGKNKFFALYHFAQEPGVVVLSSDTVLDLGRDPALVEPSSFLYVLPPHALCNIGATAKDIQTMALASRQAWQPSSPPISKQEMEQLSALKGWALPDSLIHERLDEERDFN